MPVDRFYLDGPLKEKGTVFLQEEEFHHLAHVLRIRKGESVELVNGKGLVAKALLKKIEKKQAELEILSLEKDFPPSHELILAQALPRQPRLEYILEKSVELGVTKIWLFPGELSEKKTLSPPGLERASHILVSAMKQSGRLFLPELLLLPSVFSWDPSLLPKAFFYGDTDPNANNFLSELQNKHLTSLCFIIGPEKGFHQKEVAHIKENLKGKGVRLHRNILRTDTAAICSLALASQFIFSVH